MTRADLHLRPARLAAWLVELFASAEQAESILGDLHEEFSDVASKSGMVDKAAFEREIQALLKEPAKNNPRGTSHGGVSTKESASPIPSPELPGSLAMRHRTRNSSPALELRRIPSRDASSIGMTPEASFCFLHPRVSYFNAPRPRRIPALASPRRANRAALAEFFGSPASDARDLSEKPRTVAGRGRSRWRFP